MINTQRLIGISKVEAESWWTGAMLGCLVNSLIVSESPGYVFHNNGANHCLLAVLREDGALKTPNLYIIE